MINFEILESTSMTFKSQCQYPMSMSDLTGVSRAKTHFPKNKRTSDILPKLKFKSSVLGDFLVLRFRHFMFLKGKICSNLVKISSNFL